MKSPKTAERPGRIPGRPRILHVITRLDRGGSADNTLLSCRGLADLGWDVDLVFGRTEDPSPLVEATARHRHVTMMPLAELVRPVHPVKDWVAYWKLRSILRDRAPDLVHSHCSKAGMLGRRAAHALGIPAVHTPHGHVFHGYFSAAPTRGFIAAERRAARWCTRIVTLTDRGAREHLEQGIGTASQFVTIPSGVDLSRFESPPDRREARRRFAIPDGAYVVGCVGRLERVKGQDLLLEALDDFADTVPELRLLFVGDGPLRRTLEARALERRWTDRVIFTGFKDDPSYAYAAMDLCVVPSRNEGQGRVAVEAMASGVPVAAARVGGLPEVLDGGRCGYLFAPYDAKSLARIVRVAHARPEEAACKARRARRRARMYSLEAMVSGLDSLYRDVLRDAEVQVS